MNNDPDARVRETLSRAISAEIPDAVVEVSGGSGHYSVTVRSAVFQGKALVQSHQLVYRAIAPLLSGPSAAVHAIDTLRTIAL